VRLVISLLTAICFIATAEASATGGATPQSQAAPSPSTIDIIRQPSPVQVPAIFQRLREEGYR
jgi:hypothetical protein